MAKQLFIGFDWTLSGGIPVITNNQTGDAANVRTQAFSLPYGCGLFTADQPDASLPSLSGVILHSGYGRPTPAGACLSGAMGYTGNNSNFFNGSFDNSTYPGKVMGVSIDKTKFTITDEVWLSFDFALGTGASNTGTILNVDNPAVYERSESIFQIVRWGDVTIRARRLYNVTSGDYQSATIDFAAYNGATLLGVVTATGVNNAAVFDAGRTYWFNFRLRIKLNGANGRVDLTVDGATQSWTGLNTVQTISLASANFIYFGFGGLGRLVAPSAPLWLGGALDNILIDNSEFPSGRPLGMRSPLGADVAQTNFTAIGAATLSEALATTLDGKYVRGVGSGAKCTFSIPDISTWGSVQSGTGTLATTGLNSSLVGFDVVGLEVANLDAAGARKLRMGVQLGSEDRYGTLATNQTIPLSPSIASAHDQVFYRVDGSAFALSDLYNVKTLLGVI